MNPIYANEQIEIFEAGVLEAATPSDQISLPATLETLGADSQWAIWGNDDQLPTRQIRLVEESAIMPGIMEFWEGVLYGDGIGLYEKQWDEKERKVKIVEAWDEDIEPWLQEAGAIELLLNLMPDYLSTGNGFGQYLFDGRGQIARFHHTDCVDCRLNLMKQGRPTELIISAKFAGISREGIEPSGAKEYRIPLYEAGKTYKEQAGFHIKRKKAGRKYYGLPVWWSPQTETILESAKDMFVIQRAELKNSIRAKYHIKIYRDYFKVLYQEPQFNEAYRQQAKVDLVQSVHDNLTKPENAGKAVWSDFIFDERTGEVKAGLIIEKIDGNQNDDAFVKSRDQAVAMLAMATNTNPGLADLIISGKLAGDTGSAMREAYNIMSRTKTKINRHLLLAPINQAIRHNWPDSRVYVDIKGFELATLDEAKSGMVEVTPDQPVKQEL